jgi:glycosyltransferase involved in cell wall biosynthesis
MHGKLAAMISEHELHGRVTFTGFVADRRKLAAFAAADIFVLPSYSENFAVSVAEAMFCRVPVIVSDRVNICSDVAQAVAGRVVGLSVEELTAAIAELAGDKALRDRLGAAGEALVRERFLHERVGQMLDAMYRRRGRAHPTGAMKLLHVNADLAKVTGGPAKTVIDMSIAARPFGHDISIYATTYGGETMALEPAREAGVDIRLFPVGFPEFWERSPELTRALEATIPSSNLVMIHSLYMYHSWIAASICRRNCVPYIVCPHGALDPYIYRRHRWRKAIAEALFQNRVLKGAAAVHYTTEDERRLAAPVAHNTSAEVVPLSLNADDYRPLPPRGEFRAAFPEIGNRRIVLFLGRLNFKKGLDLLIPAFAQVLEQGRDLHLVLAGPQDDEMRPKLAAMIEKYDIADRVTFPGYIDGRQKLAALADADMFVLPSYSENFAVSVAEAMFCRLPVIVTDRVNICGDVSRANAGRVITPNVEELAAAIAELAGDENLRQSLGSAGEALVRERFLHERVGQKLDQMYRRHARSTK